MCTVQQENVQVNYKKKSVEKHLKKVLIDLLKKIEQTIQLEYALNSKWVH